MLVKIRLAHGPRIRKSNGKKHRAALALAALLVPACVVAWMFALWALGADMGLTGTFAIGNGLLSHWQVWVGAAVVLQWGIYRLNRFGQSIPETAGPANPKLP